MKVVSVSLDHPVKIRLKITEAIFTHPDLFIGFKICLQWVRFILVKDSITEFTLGVILDAKCPIKGSMLQMAIHKIPFLPHHPPIVPPSTFPG